MTSFPNQANRPCKTFGIYALATILASLALGLLVEPALADRDNRHKRERQWRHEQQQNERHWRESQRRSRVYVAPPFDPYYAPPPPVYYYPQPVAPSLNLIIPLRIH